jgi:hypothetical protein
VGGQRLPGGRGHAQGGIGAGKLAYAGACGVAFAQGAATPALLAVGYADLVFAVLFATAAARPAPKEPEVRPA